MVRRRSAIMADIADDLFPLHDITDKLQNGAEPNALTPVLG